MAGWARRPQRGADHPWLHQQPSRRRPQPGQRRSAGLVGRADRAGQGDRYRQGFCRRLEHAGLVLRFDQRASPDPRTGRPYGPDFPAITVSDIVAAQKALLDSLGVRHLVAVAGPSYGGYQAFQWAVTYPDMMDAVVAVVTAPRSQNAEESLAELQARLATDPEWHGGRYYGKGGAKTVLTQMRFETLMRYGYNEQLAGRYPDKAARERAIHQLAADWARNWDANSLVILRRATIGFDTVKDFARFRAKVLYVLCRSDVLFPPSLAPGVMQDLAAAGVEARYFEIDSDLAIRRAVQSTPNGRRCCAPFSPRWSPNSPEADQRGGHPAPMLSTSYWCEFRMFVRRSRLSSPSKWSSGLARNKERLFQSDRQLCLCAIAGTGRG